MSLPRWIPKDIRAMIVTARPFDESKDDAHDLILREEQKEAMLQKSFSKDKQRAVKANQAEIQRVRSYLAKDNNKDKDRTKRWQDWLDKLLALQFELLCDEILNSCKDSAGLIDYEKLALFPGSPEYRKRKERKINKRKTK